MASKYDHKAIEKKWQKKWEDTQAFKAIDDSSKEKNYLLIEFPYPSGDGLHVGHVRSWTALDVVARKRRAEGKNVLYPIGWDAFGLPAENYAIKTGIHPKIVTKQNTDNFRRQIKSIGISFDWSREINTTDPKYYKWTQWIFLQLFKQGLAYKAKIPVNWCPKDKIVLANEEVVDGCCERCGTPVEKREKEQWMLAITKYAKRLYDDLDTVDYIERAKVQQKNWIGPSEGAEITFPLNLPVLSGEVVFASNNDGKLRRMQKLIKTAGLSITLKTPKDIGVELHVEEDAPTLAENAEKKARAYAEHTNLPVLADDTGFFIEGEEIDPKMVKRNALNGEDEKKFSVEEISQKMQAYYKDIARKHGGKVDAEWRNALCMITPGKMVLHAEGVRPVVLTDEAHGTVDPHLPVRGLYIAKASGKYALEQTEEEELMELRPITDALIQICTPGIKVFTTRPDTLFGATYMVLAPEHLFVKACIERKAIQNVEEIAAYVGEAKKKSEVDRSAEGKEKTGVELKGIKAINPANHEEIPIFIADYVLGSYGTGAIMAVPAHDDRDGAFAKKFGLPFREIEFEDPKKITEKVGGKWVVNYKLRDWVFSRQRYWGEPIPMIHCEKDGWVPVPEDQLPVELPQVEKYQPTDNGESPLAGMDAWVNTTCPKCGGPAKRETDVMPNWAGSSWYYLRYADPVNDKEFASPEKLNYWTPVDWYNGGMEHTVLHLLYSRFWHKFLFDQGLVPTSEPYMKRTSHGLIMAADGSKMSKSKGNTVSPDEIVETFGADSLRLYEMFLGPFDQPVAWNTSAIIGVRRFLERVWSIGTRFSLGMKLSGSGIKLPGNEFDNLLNKTIKKVGEDIEGLKFNTAVSALMILLNEFETLQEIPRDAYKTLLILLTPFAPHATSELWENAKFEGDISGQSWPIYDKAAMVGGTAKVAVQVNGKVRGSIMVPQGASEGEALDMARKEPAVAKWLALGKEEKAVYVAGRIISFAVSTDPV